jgi:energy-coupling factor transporter ATP-binding protein EcfA2
MQEELNEVQSNYLSLKVSTIPLNGLKQPLVKNWQAYGHEFTGELVKPEFSQQDFKGLGMVLGDDCPYMCVDIDSTDAEIIKCLRTMIPYTPLQRFSSKGVMLFYAKNKNIQSRKFNAIHVEIFSSSGYVAVPPSWNDKANGGLGGKSYWIDKSIFDINVESLPTVSEDDIKKLEYFNGQQKENNSKKTEGRHNRLFAQVMAALYKYEDLDIIARQITEYDLKWHNPSYFKDPSHPYKAKSDADVLKCARKWVDNILKTWEKSNGKYDAPKSEEVLENIKARPKFEVKSYPEPMGILKEITEYILSESYTYVPNMALGSAIAIFTTILGNKIEFGDIRGNCFVLLLADSGSGKKFGLNAAKKILTPYKRVGSADYMSSSAIASSLVDNIVRLDLNDEFSKLLKVTQGNVWQAAIPQELTKLWSASSSSFDLPTYSHATGVKDEKKESMVHFPYVSILAATTPSELKANLGHNAFSSGFFPRFLVFMDKTPKDALVWLDEDKNKALFEGVKDRLKYFIKPAEFSMDSSIEQNLVKVVLSESAKSLFTDHMNHFFADAMKTSNESMKAIKNRAREYYKKLALIHCYSRQGSEIESCDLIWSKEVVETSFYNCHLFVAEASAENRGHSYKERVYGIIAENPGITKNQLTRKTQYLEKRSRESILQDLIEADRVFVSMNNSGRRGPRNEQYYASDIENA